MKQKVSTNGLRKNLVNKQAHQVGEAGHINQLKQRPLPALGFSFYYSQRTHALHRQYIKDHQRKRRGQGIHFSAICIGGSLHFLP